MAAIFMHKLPGDSLLHDLLHLQINGHLHYFNVFFSGLLSKPRAITLSLNYTFRLALLFLTFLLSKELLGFEGMSQWLSLFWTDKVLDSILSTKRENQQQNKFLGR